MATERVESGQRADGGGPCARLTRSSSYALELSNARTVATNQYRLHNQSSGNNCPLTVRFSEVVVAGAGAADVKVSAWISAQPISAGNDSGKVVLAVKISGITEAAGRSLKPDQIVLRAEFGRVYLPFGAPSPIPTAASASFVAHFYRVEANSAGQYVLVLLKKV